MSSVSERYSSTRRIFSFFEAVGWIGAAISIVWSLYALISAGGFGATMDGRLAATVPAIMSFFSSFALVALARFGMTGVDTAENTAELLSLHRRQERPAQAAPEQAASKVSTERGEERTEGSTGPAGEIYRTYEGVPIYHSGDGGFIALGQKFWMFVAATTHVDEQQAQRNAVASEPLGGA